MGRTSLGFSGQPSTWVLVQIPVLAVALALPPYTGCWPGEHLVRASVAGVLLLFGLSLVWGAAWQLGKGLSPFPVPKSNAKLQCCGLYRYMRHPIYTGAVLAVFGWSLWWRSWPGMLWAFAVFAFFDRKAAYEERWLLARFPEYRHYQENTAKFFPFVY